MSLLQLDLEGDPICIALVNTWPRRPHSAGDRLRSYQDLIIWAQQTGSLAPHEDGTLHAAAAARQEAAGRAMEEARSFREALYRLLTARAAGDRPSGPDLQLLNRRLGRAMARLRLVPGQACCGWSWEFGPDDLDRPLWPAVRSAAELLASPEAELLHECEASDCSWLFLDRSRGRRRRWCEMATCGNREKARRYYRRKRAAGKPAS